jgi:hypothetical protein
MTFDRLTIHAAALMPTATHVSQVPIVPERKGCVCMV